MPSLWVAAILWPWLGLPFVAEQTSFSFAGSA